MSDFLRLTNIGKHQVPNIPHHAPLITISDKYSYPPPIPNEKNRPVLRLDFFPGDHLDANEKDEAIKPEQVRKLVEFVQDNREAGHIYVQCGEGRIRSWTICSVLSRQLDLVLHDTEISAIKNGNVDRWTHNVLRTVLTEMQSEGLIKEVDV